MFRNIIVTLALVVGLVCIAFAMQLDAGKRTVALHAPVFVASVITQTGAGE